MIGLAVAEFSLKASADTRKSSEKLVFLKKSDILSKSEAANNGKPYLIVQIKSDYDVS